MSLRRFLLVLSLIVLSAPAWRAQTRATRRPASPQTVSAADLDKGLRQLLDGSYTKAVRELGREDGFLRNARVKIPVPKQLRPVEKTLRALGRGKVADDFITAMNRAAEKAVPEALSIFADSLKQMTFNDAKNIISGPQDAATQFFRRTSEERLREKFRPIVERFTQETGVTAQYKRFIERAGPLARLGGKDAQDLDGYVTQKALDGLFLLMADEEKRIRENPVARTTDLLKIIFGRR
jgi:hypothetical protein